MEAQRRLLSALGAALTADSDFATLLRFARQLRLSHFAKAIDIKIYVYMIYIYI